MRPLLVLSIPHTGTMFTYDLLPGQHGGREVLPDHKYWRHLTEPDAMEFKSQCFTVVPLRHRAAVEHSWLRRRLDLRELDRQWGLMRTLTDVFTLSIDDPVCRDSQLARLSQRLEYPLNTDWRPTNHFVPPSRPHAQ
jgi:hypothetical protein